MAKISRAQGPSMTPEEFDGAEYVSPRVPDPRIRRAGIGPMKRASEDEVTSSGGTNSQASTAQPQTSESSENSSNQEPAPTTENPSVRKVQSSGVHSVDGAPTETESQPSSSTKPPVKAAKSTTASKRARVRSVDEDDF